MNQLLSLLFRYCTQKVPCNLLIWKKWGAFINQEEPKTELLFIQYRASCTQKTQVHLHSFTIQPDTKTSHSRLLLFILRPHHINKKKNQKIKNTKIKNIERKYKKYISEKNILWEIAKAWLIFTLYLYGYI